MKLALDDAHIEEPWRSDLLHFFGRSSAYVVNQGTVVDDGPITPALSACWHAQTELDRAVAAIRAGDATGAIALAEGQSWSPLVHTGVMAAMIRRGTPEMLNYVRKRLQGERAFVEERFAGRTLLHDAAAAGCLPMVELLLALGADPNVKDGGEHTPLYSVANECSIDGADAVARVLVRAGAAVDAQDGAIQCTALHMAARRGNVAVAAVLLDLGADIDANDRRGDTPLRRAVNCNQVGVARLLLDKGADVRSRGSKGLTPIDAARSSAMKALFQPLQ